MSPLPENENVSLIYGLSVDQSPKSLSEICDMTISAQLIHLIVVETTVKSDAIRAYGHGRDARLQCNDL